MRLKLSWRPSPCFHWLACGSRRPQPPATEASPTRCSLSGKDGEWLSYGNDYAEQRFSTLTQINRSRPSASSGLAWSADLDTARGQEATPLMHDGMLYITTAWSMVKAYDAKTGALKWAYDPKVPREKLVDVCCDAVNRGVALYGDKVYVGTLDGRLVALDQQDRQGRVWTQLTIPKDSHMAITGAPRIVKGKVLIGSAGVGIFHARLSGGVRRPDRQGTVEVLHRPRRSGEAAGRQASRSRRQDLDRRMVEAGRRRHGVGFDHL